MTDTLTPTPASPTPDGEDRPAIGAPSDPARPATARTAGRRQLAGWRGDLVVYAVFLLAAVALMARLWLDVHHRVLGSNPTDQSFAEWMYADQANALRHLRNPFFSHGQNAPLGINLMGNVATQLVSWLFAPVTLIFGPPVTFALVTTLNLAATASAWYYVLSRHLVRSRTAAIIGAAFCGFSPGMISESNSHVHIPAQYLVPFLLLAVLRLREPGRAVRGGLILGALISVQLLIGEEVLFLTAFACAIALAGYAILRWREARAALRPVLSGLAVAVVLTLVVCGYPLWMQFFGPRHYQGIVGTFSADATNVFAFPTQSIGGLTAGKSYAADPAEETMFFGWPLVIASLGLAALLWRSLFARLVAITGVITAALALGSPIMIKGHNTHVPGPYRLLSHVPVFDSLVTTRLGLITSVAIGLLLAFATDWVREHAANARAAHIPLRGIAVAGAVAVLFPLVPKPFSTIPTPFVPKFITSGDWHGYVRTGRTLVGVDPAPFTNLRWAVAGNAEFAVPGGFTLVPADPPRKMIGVFNVPQLPTEAQLWNISMGYATQIGADEQRQAITDLHTLRADAVVLNASITHAADSIVRISLLLGAQPEQVDDVYVWRVSE